jgi:hypothetical protein
MNRRFCIPSMQQPRAPQQRNQRLPDDLNDFIPSGHAVSPKQPPVTAPISMPSDSPADPIPSPPIAPAPPNSPASFAPQPVVDPAAGLKKRAALPVPPKESPAPRPARNRPAPAQLGQAQPEPAASSSRSMLDSISKLVDLAEAKPAERFSLADMPYLNRDFKSLSEFPSRSNVAMCAASLQEQSRRNTRLSSRQDSAADGTLDPSAALKRHQRKCVICSHPERDMIEFYFLRWHSAYQIAADFGLSNISGVYRHARALGLFPQRGRNLRAMLEMMFETVGNVRPTADTLVRAVRTYASLTEEGEWIEPATTHHIVAGTVPASAPPRGESQNPAPQLDSLDSPCSVSTSRRAKSNRNS